MSVQKINANPPSMLVSIVFGGVATGMGYGLDHFNVNDLLMDALYKTNEKVNAFFLLSMVLLTLLNLYLSMKVVGARYLYNVPHPFMYPFAGDKRAESSKPAEYMAVVRGHENFLEFAPFVIGVSFLVQYVLELKGIATTFMLAFVVARFLYAVGYASGNIKARVPGFFLSLLAFWGMVGTLAWNFVDVVVLN